MKAGLKNIFNVSGSISVVIKFVKFIKVKVAGARWWRISHFTMLRSK